MQTHIDELQATLAKFPRMHGYYLLNLVDIEWTDDENASLDVIMQRLDDHAWPPREQHPTPDWIDNVDGRGRGRRHAGRDPGRRRRRLRSIVRQARARFAKRLPLARHLIVSSKRFVCRNSWRGTIAPRPPAARHAACFEIPEHAG
jgi:hypothetical protein